jgi:hypothetical protein
VVIFGKPEYFHHKLVQIGNLSDTISDSGVCTILYAAKLAELTDMGVTESSLNNLVLDLGRNNQDGSLLKQMQAEITHLMHELSRKYSSVCVHDSQIIYPSIFHSSQDDSSECGDSSKQVCPFQQMIVQHLFGGPDKINSLLTILYWRKYHVQYQILLVRMVTI